MIHLPESAGMYAALAVILAKYVIVAAAVVIVAWAAFRLARG